MQTDRRRAWDRARHARDKEKRNTSRRAAHAANPERLREKERERYRADPERSRNIDIKSKYGEAALLMYLATTACHSCGDAVAGKHKHIDHTHGLGRREVGALRGILCSGCNLALGHLRDDPKRIKSLLSYLAKFLRRKHT